MLLALLWVPLAFGSLLVLLSIPFQVVTRARLLKLARRQSLVITPANGPVVIGYLATTRRWRGTGILLSILGGTAYLTITHSDAELGTSALFAGWFVGAVIAEWRISVRTSSGAGPRQASLTPRRLADYLPVHVRLLVLGATLLIAVADCAAVLSDQRRPRCAFWLAVTVAAAVVLVLVSRHILARPQPLAEADVLAADEAIRSRSLHVLAGAALAIAGYLAAVAVGTPSDGLDRLAPWTGAGGVLLPLLGLVVACAASRPPARLAGGAARRLLE